MLFPSLVLYIMINGMYYYVISFFSAIYDHVLMVCKYYVISFFSNIIYTYHVLMVYIALEGYNIIFTCHYIHDHI